MVIISGVPIFRIFTVHNVSCPSGKKVHLFYKLRIKCNYFRDSIPHVTPDHLSTEKNKELVRNITNLMKHHFPTVPIYATFGNHDYYPRDQFPPHNNEIYNATYEIWKSWIGNLSQEQYFLKGNRSFKL